jgi:hypothetical protein
MSCPINYEDEEDTQPVKARLEDSRHCMPVPDRNTVSRKKYLFSHAPQECAGNKPNLALTDRGLGIARI